MSFKKILLLPVLLCAFGCCKKDAKIIIISTNDIHSSIDAFPSLAEFVEGQRKENTNVLVVDAGDRWTGNPYVDLAPVKYKPVIDLMNKLNYDIATYGNHEWDSGMQILVERTRQSRFGNILANADFSGTEMEGINPYHLTEIDGIRICFLGLVTTAVNGHPDGLDENFGNISFFNAFETAKRFKNLRDSCDLYIALSHLGFEEDSILAVTHPEFDLIIGGHSHTVIPEGKKINRTVVTQAGSRLKYAGLTTVTHNGKRIKSIENRLVILDTIPAHKDYQIMVDTYNNEPKLKEAVSETTAQLDKTALMNLFSDIMRLQTGSHFAFYNMGGMRLSHLPAGFVTVADIYSAEPFGNFPVIVDMTTEEIAQMILNKFNSEGKESHALDLYPSGFTYEIVTDGEGKGTDIFIKHNFYPERGKLYKVAMSNYVNTTYDFEKKGTGEEIETIIAELALEYFKNNPVIVPDTIQRVIIN